MRIAAIAAEAREPLAELRMSCNVSPWAAGGSTAQRAGRTALVWRGDGRLVTARCHGKDSPAIQKRASGQSHMNVELIGDQAAHAANEERNGRGNAKEVSHPSSKSTGSVMGARSSGSMLSRASSAPASAVARGMPTDWILDQEAETSCCNRRAFARALRRALPSKLSVNSVCSSKVK